MFDLSVAFDIRFMNKRVFTSCLKVSLTKATGYHLSKTKTPGFNLKNP